MQEDVFDFIPGVCCCCWILPAALLILPAVIGRSIQNGWRMRGLKAGRLYCAGCRYDLRGGAGMACPECGKSLTGNGIYQAGLDPPQDTTSNVLMAIMLAAAPVFVIGYLVLAVIPFNYVRTTQVWLRTPIAKSAHMDEMSIFIATERSRWNDGVIAHEIWLNGPAGRVSWPIEPGQDPASVFTAEAFALKLQDIGVEFLASDIREEHRLQLINVVEHLNASGTTPPTLNTPLEITCNTRLKFSPGSIQVILIALAGIVALAYILQWAVLYSDTQRREYHEKCNAAAQRYRRQVEGNPASGPQAARGATQGPAPNHPA